LIVKDIPILKSRLNNYRGELEEAEEEPKEHAKEEIKKKREEKEQRGKKEET